MKKNNYRTKKVNDINWSQLREQFAGQPLVFAVDVAKEQQFALLSNPELSESVLMHWNHLEQTAELINELSYSKAFKKEAEILKIEPFNVTKSTNRWRYFRYEEE